MGYYTSIPLSLHDEGKVFSLKKKKIAEYRKSEYIQNMKNFCK